ncbi:helix-turn-helix domain-containing protein [Gudongella sp. DL1XJH-153]|uniref:helix-turn-helix domain-containing protein n=1 Tax=Gudongella sp. DL1XJH-153 TaxID=3409804 RepID=UPI003BB52C5D
MSLNELIQVGSRIKKVRKEKGINQKFMAEEVLKIPRSTYSNYENNNRTPDLETLDKIAEALEIEVSELLGIEEPKKFNFELNDFLNEKLFEIIKYIIKDQNLDTSLNVSAIDFYKKDKYLNELILKSTRSIIENYVETLKEKILHNPKDLTPIKGDILINYPFGDTSKIQGVYNLGSKEETFDYLKYEVMENFNKMITAEYSKVDYSLPEDELHVSFNEANNRIERVIKDLHLIFIDEINNESLKNDIRIKPPSMFQDKQ